MGAGNADESAGPESRVNSTAIVAATVVVCFSIAAVTIVIATGNSAAQLIGLLTAVIGPSIASIVALSKVDHATEQIALLQQQQTKDTPNG